MSLSPLSAALNCKYDVSLVPAVCQWPAVEQACCLLLSCFSLIRLRTLNCERCWEPSWGRTGTPLGSEGMCTHAPPDICEFKDCEFKDSVGFFCLFFTTKIIDGIQVFWFISQFGKKIPT